MRMDQSETAPDLEKGLAEKAPTGTTDSTTLCSPTTISPLIQSHNKWGRWRPQLPGWLSRPKVELPPIRVRQLDSHVRGYPNLAAFLDSDESFMIYRRFGWLQSRLLLDRQEELRLLEKKLHALDEKEAAARASTPMTRDAPEPARSARRKLLQRIDSTLIAYSKQLVAAQQLVGFNKPSETDYKSVCTYMVNKEPLVDGEKTWIEYKEDTITLRPGREHAWLDIWIEHTLRLFHNRVIEYFFCPPEDQRKSKGDEEVYYVRNRIERLAAGIITFMILVLLIVPVNVLYHLVSGIGDGRAYATAIGVILVFTLAFSTVLSLFTKAKRHEILGAAAAYCAVLVVFLGNVNGPRSGNTSKYHSR